MKTNLLQKNIPKGWLEKSLGNFLSISKGKLPKKTYEVADENSVPYLSIKCLDGNEVKYGHKSDGVLADRSDLLVVADGSGSGRMYRGYHGLVSSTFLKISTQSPSEISNDYLEVLFSYLDFTNSRFRKGGAIPHFDFKQLKDVLILLPPIKEQKRIAEILKIMDDKIQKTNEIIVAAKKLKRGLMRQLFNSGNKVILDTVAKRGSGHTPNKQHTEYWNGGIKWVSLADSSKLDDRYIFETDKEISLKGIENSSAVLHKKNTVVVCRDAGIGKVAILGTDNMAVSQHFIAWRSGEKLNFKYLYYWLQSQKNALEQIATGTTIKTIGLSFFKNLQIPLPDVKQQEKIGDTFWLIDEKILINEKLKAKLASLKKGLSQDLLSGKKRTI